MGRGIWDPQALQAGGEGQEPRMAPGLQQDPDSTQRWPGVETSHPQSPGASCPPHRGPDLLGALSLLPLSGCLLRHCWL